MPAVRGTVEIAVEVCKGCELCIEACPQESLALAKDLNKRGYHYAVLVKDNCTGCVNCALVCPDAVITVYRSHKKGGAAAQKVREPIAVVSRLTGDVTISVEPVPEGGVSL